MSYYFSPIYYTHYDTIMSNYDTIISLIVLQMSGLLFSQMSGLLHNESSIIDAGWPNHDGVHSMTSVEHFRWKWIAVNPLHTLVLGVAQHQTIEQFLPLLRISIKLVVCNLGLAVSTVLMWLADLGSRS